MTIPLYILLERSKCSFVPMTLDDEELHVTIFSIQSPRNHANGRLCKFKVTTFFNLISLNLQSTQHSHDISETLQEVEKRSCFVLYNCLLANIKFVSCVLCIFVLLIYLCAFQIQIAVRVLQDNESFFVSESICQAEIIINYSQNLVSLFL